jgi:tRNA (guanine-N7-)-methyltransferase
MTERPLRSYGRVKGRALKPRQAGLVETLLPHLAVPDEGAIELSELFAPSPLAPLSSILLAPSPYPLPAGEGDSSPVVLEIGFGGGEHLAAQAAAHAEWRFIGVEPFLNGVASCLRHIEESGVQNVRLHQGDARDVTERLPDACLARVYMLFPDPWPKARHWKRRLIQPDFIAALARVVKPGGEVRFATDWRHYAAWTLAMFHKEPGFAWTAERAEDWRAAWPGHVRTRYEQKRLGDCAPIWLCFVRTA